MPDMALDALDVSAVPLYVSALPVASALVLEAYTTPPEVKLVSPVPPFVVASVPVTPVERGKPVALVRVTEVGVPRIGVTSVGLVAKTLFPVPVLVTLTTSLLAFRASAVEAVRADRVVVPTTVSAEGLLPSSTTEPPEFLVNNRRSAVFTASSEPLALLVRLPAEGTLAAVLLA
jgi:hypothetical protein